MRLKVGTRGMSKGIREPGKRQIEWKGVSVDIALRRPIRHS